MSNTEKLIAKLKKSLEDGTASDPHYCIGMVAMLEDKLKSER